MPAACRTLGYVVILDQILFISGVTLTIGLKSSMQFFTKRSNFKVYTLCLFHIMMFLFYIPPYGFRVVQGTISFALGFLLVMIGWPVLGMILEAYGFIVLFRFTYLKKIKFPSMITCALLILMIVIADELFSAVVSGLHWQFLCRRYLFLDGFSNSHLLDQYVFLICSTVISVGIYSGRSQLCSSTKLILLLILYII